MNKNKKDVDALKEQLPQIRTEAEKTALNEFGEVLKSGDPEKLKTLPEKFESLSSELQEVVMNATKMTNRTAIIEAYESLTAELGRMPNVLEVAAKTGLSKVTVYAHRDELLADGFWKEELEGLKMQRVKFLNVITKAGYKDARAAKMILDIINAPVTPAPTKPDESNTEKNQNKNN